MSGIHYLVFNFEVRWDLSPSKIDGKNCWGFDVHIGKDSRVRHRLQTRCRPDWGLKHEDCYNPKALTGIKASSLNSRVKASGLESDMQCWLGLPVCQNKMYWTSCIPQLYCDCHSRVPLLERLIAPMQLRGNLIYDRIILSSPQIWSVSELQY